MLTKFTEKKRIARSFSGRGFTLVELLVTLTILAVLIIIVVVLIDPGELFAKTRDTRRFADLAALRSAMIFAVSTGETIDFDGTNNLTCADETTPTVYVSLPSTVAMQNPPTGWSWKQASDANLTKTNGTGWLPVNLDELSGGSPLFNLPLDPRNDNSGTSKFFYSYACNRATRKFELNAKLESQTMGPGGKDDKSFRDGGDAPAVYEIGASPTVLPISGVY